MMQGAADETRSMAGTAGDALPDVADMAALVDRVRELVVAARCRVRVLCEGRFDRDEFARQSGFVLDRRGTPEVILGPATALELGHPSVPSCSAVLLTEQREQVVHGRVSCLGPELDAMAPGERRPFAQLVLLGLAPGARPDPFDLENAQYLTNRLPGHMVRSVPGRLWVRIGKAALAGGLDLQTVGRALVAAYEADFEDVLAVEVLFVTESARAVEALAPLTAEAAVLAGRHKKLVLSPDGDIECTELNCETCEEKPVCDNIRDVARRRRR